MEKIPFNTLNLSIINETKKVVVGEQEIEVKQYLPIQEKLDLISRVINLAMDQNAKFTNPIQVEAIGAIAIIMNYSNLEFTEEELNNLPQLYDTLESNGIFNLVFAAIPNGEYAFITAGIDDTIAALYKYHQSALGILDTISTDYSNLNLESKEIEKNLSNPENLSLLKDVLTKLG